MTDSDDREAFALLRRLSLRGAVIRATADGGYRLQHASSGEGPQVNPAVVSDLVSRGLVAPAGDGAILMSAAGRSALRRRLAGGLREDFAAQHRSLVAASIDDGAVRHTVTINADESPLAWLRRRKGRDGRPMLDAAQFQAGERLRADFTRGQLAPRITANWDAAVASGRRSGDGRGVAELTDAALAARRRVEKALAVVGPEFGGPLLDFCCFLKGIEEIERDRGWPARSAKLVLRLALDSLARHYGIAAKVTAPDRAGRLRHWGTDDYRPSISGEVTPASGRPARRP